MGKVVKQVFKEEGELEQIWKILATFGLVDRQLKSIQGGRGNTNKGVGAKLNKAWLGNCWWNNFIGIEGSWEK